MGREKAGFSHAAGIGYDLEHDDDEVRYDEIGPNPDLRLNDSHNQQEIPFAKTQFHSDVSDKIITTARLMGRRTRESAKVYTAKRNT